MFTGELSGVLRVTWSGRYVSNALRVRDIQVTKKGTDQGPYSRMYGFDVSKGGCPLWRGVISKKGSLCPIDVYKGNGLSRNMDTPKYFGIPSSFSLKQQKANAGRKRTPADVVP